MNIMTLRSIGLFLAGLIVGGLVIYGITAGFKTPFSNKPKIAKAPPAPTAVPKPTQDRQKALDNLRKQLYQQGVSINATVDTVYPGVGFTIRDDAGTILFVAWDKTSPEINKNVTIKGTIQKVADRKEDLSNQPSYTQDLDGFLSNQQVLINASEVTPTSS